MQLLKQLVMLDRIFYQFSVIITFCTVACTSARKATYFYNLTDTLLLQTAKIYNPPVFRSNDIISVDISSDNPAASQLFNLPSSGSSALTNASGTIPYAPGYLINNEGNIQIPGLGVIKAAGYTRTQLESNIAQKLLDRGLLKNPIVIIRHLNFKVTVIGEVGRPGVVSIPSEKVSILEALGLAGDVSVYGKKDDILLIRGNGAAVKLNLNDRQLFKSQYYYLEPDDVIYVPPTNAKVASASQSKQWLPIVFSGLSFVAIVVDRLLR